METRSDRTGDVDEALSVGATLLSDSDGLVTVRVTPAQLVLITALIDEQARTNQAGADYFTERLRGLEEDAAHLAKSKADLAALSELRSTISPEDG